MPDKLKNHVKSMQLNVDSVIGFAGFALMVTTLLCLLREIPLSFSFDIGFDTGNYSPLIGLFIFGIAITLSFAGISRFAFQISAKSCFPLVVIAAIGASASVVSLLPLFSSGVFGGLCLLVMGTGMAGLACLWFVNLCSGSEKVILFYLVVGICTGCVFCLGISFMESFVSRVATACTFGISCVLGFFAVRFDESKFFCKVDNKTSDRRTRINLASTFMLASTFFEFGFLVSYIGDEFLVAISLITAIGTTIVISADSISNKYIKERNLAPIVPALTVFSFMLLVMNPVRRLFLWSSIVILTALLTTYMSLGFTAMTHHIRLSKLSPIRLFSRARLIDYTVFVFGLVLGYTIRSIPNQYGMFFGTGIALCFCFISLLSNRSKFPEAGFEEAENPVETSVESNRKRWRQRCRAVGEENNLSERQMEILMIVAQGRDAKYVAKSLTISLSTVQTHIRNIYRKLGVHSRQELFDMIEQTKLYGEDY